MSLNIISTDPNPEADVQLLSVARTLKGHKAAVTDTHIVGVGKTVYSCGKDGSIRLWWDVAQASKIGSTLTSEGFNPILRMSAASAANNTGSTDPGVSSEEGHVICCMIRVHPHWCMLLLRHNGHIPCYSLLTTHLLIFSSSQLLATGTTAGVVEIYDTRQLPSLSPSSSPSNPLCSFKCSDASIDDLLFTDSSRAPPSLLVATGDGLCVDFRVVRWSTNC